MDLTPAQISQLQSLGIKIDQSPAINIKKDQTSALSSAKIPDQTLSSTPSTPLLTPTESPCLYGQTNACPPWWVSAPSASPHPNIIPLLSISGLTLLSFGGIILFKSQPAANPNLSPAEAPAKEGQILPTATQVPKSIQHYLLTSQTYFSQAIQSQSSDPPKTIDLLNQSILAASEAIDSFPQDYRGYEQRARIYQSLLDSQPQLISQSILDLTHALSLNPSSPDLTRTLASLYAQKGDADSTIAYLTQTVSLEPTKAQNFYDLARLEQQTGRIHQALNTYTRLIPLITDPSQLAQVQTEKSALEKILAENPAQPSSPSPNPKPQILNPNSLDAPTIQAANLTDSNLIIAAPETSKNITVANITDTNSLSGTATLPQDQKEITIENTQLTSNSQVYLVAIKGGKNLNLQVLSRSAASFVVGLDSPTFEPIDFKWWIINP